MLFNEQFKIHAEHTFTNKRNNEGEQKLCSQEGNLNQLLLHIIEFFFLHVNKRYFIPLVQ